MTQKRFEMGYKYGAIFAGKSQASPSGSPSDHNERTEAFPAPRFLAMICLSCTSLLSWAAALMRPFLNKTNLTFSENPPSPYQNFGCALGCLQNCCFDSDYNLKQYGKAFFLNTSSFCFFTSTLSQSLLQSMTLQSSNHK